MWEKWRGSLILSLRSQNLYSVLSLNSSSRFRRVGKWSLVIPGCVVLVTIFINSFLLGSGSISSIILVIVELLISFSGPDSSDLFALFRSHYFIISSIPLESASTLLFSFFISDIIASTSPPSSPFFLSSCYYICLIFSPKPSTSFLTSSDR